jgi:hypothetical protein
MRYFYIQSKQNCERVFQVESTTNKEKERKFPIGHFPLQEHVEYQRLCRVSARTTIAIILLSPTKRTDIEDCIFFAD